MTFLSKLRALSERSCRDWGFRAAQLPGMAPAEVVTPEGDAMGQELSMFAGQLLAMSNAGLWVISIPQQAENIGNHDICWPIRICFNNNFKQLNSKTLVNTLVICC